MRIVMNRGRQAVLSAFVLVIIAGCGWFGGATRPSWVDGGSPQFPSTQYLTGVGQADSRPQATEQAYAAVSKIFKAEITAQAKDWESYLVVESRGQTRTERRLTLDTVTRVTTDKVLENVQVLDTWFDQTTRQYYALAGMNRAQAESAMESEARLVMLDGSLPEPVLQFEVVDRDGRLWRLDFAWPDQLPAVEYDGFEYHSSPEHLRRDRQKRAALEELGWVIISIVGDDVRRRPAELVRRIDSWLYSRAAA